MASILGNERKKIKDLEMNWSNLLIEYMPNGVKTRLVAVRMVTGEPRGIQKMESTEHGNGLNIVSEEVEKIK